MFKFKVPQIRISNKYDCLFAGVPRFRNEDLGDKEEIGTGGFGRVVKATYAKTKGTVAVKLQHGEDEDTIRNMAKEVKLHLDLCHENITDFISVCVHPPSLMMGYESFHFGPFGIDRSAHNLAQFLNISNSLDDGTFFFDLFPKIVHDVVCGMCYLHKKGVAHRDLKPLNILVTNRAYAELDHDSTEFKEQFSKNPIRCKLTDFGESRSEIIQTRSILHARTRNLERGTTPFLAPEVLVPELKLDSAGLDDLFRIDIWALGMTMFSILNPDIGYPFQVEFKSYQRKPDAEITEQFKTMIIRMLRNGERPSPSPKYKPLQMSTWDTIHKIYLLCTVNNPSSRPSMQDILLTMKPSECPSSTSSPNVPLTPDIAAVLSKSTFQEPPQDDGGKIEPTRNIFEFINDIVIGDNNRISSVTGSTEPDIISKDSQSSSDRSSQSGSGRNASNTVRSEDHRKQGPPGNDCTPVYWNKAVIADFHQASEDIFFHSAAGSQCSSMSIMAVVYAVNRAPITWEKQDLHKILEEGNCIHLSILDKLGWPERRNDSNLAMDEFPETFECKINGKKVRCSISLLPNAKYAFDLTEVISSATKQHPEHSFILRIEDKFRSIIRGADGTISLFDSHACDARGRQDPHGGACIMHFCDVLKLLKHVTKLAPVPGREQIDVYPVDVNILGEVEDHVQEYIEYGCISNQYSDDNLCEEKSEYIEYECSAMGDVESHDKPCQEDETDFPHSNDRVNERGKYDQNHTVVGTISGENLDKTRYNNNPQLPIFEQGKRKRYTNREAIEILIKSNSKRCSKVPLYVRRDYAFLIDMSQLKAADDIKIDMNGAYTTFLRSGTWTVEISDSGIVIIDKKKLEKITCDQYHLSINSKKNKAGLCRSIFILYDHTGNVVNNTGLLQYHIDEAINATEVEFEVAPHGNRKHGKKSFQPMQRSTLSEIKDKVRDGEHVSSVYSECSKMAGGVLGVEHIGQLPRSMHQIYQIKCAMSKTDEIEELKLYIKSKEEDIVLEHSDNKDDLWVIGTTEMCNDISRFSTERWASYPFSVDPTFELGKFEVTPFTYRHMLLRTKRSNGQIPPLFMGPTAIHDSKDQETFEKIVTTVTRKSPLLKDALGFITDGEKALINALKGGIPNAVPLRCFRHFRSNCVEKLNKIGIKDNKSQRQLLRFVFGINQKDGLVDCKNKDALEIELSEIRSEMCRLEARLLDVKEDNYNSKFWAYLKKNQPTLAESMLVDKRVEAGMPLGNEGGIPQRCYSNQSESLNNILTRRKQAVMNGPKKLSVMSKLGFVKDVWEEVHQQQRAELALALSGSSDVYELSSDAAYLGIEQHIWNSWSEGQRREYFKSIDKLTMKDVRRKRKVGIPVQKEQPSPRERRRFSEDVVQALIEVTTLSKGLLIALVKEAEDLLSLPYAISDMPALDQNTNTRKFLVASTATKCKYVTCTLYTDHVRCDCNAYRTHQFCKHSLCVAENHSLLQGQLKQVSKGKKRGRSVLTDGPKEAAGKKGGHHRNPYRPRSVDHSPKRPCYSLPTHSPFTDIHHNNHPLEVCFLEDEQKAKECYQCKVEFPRIELISPYDIVISHKEKWNYTTQDAPDIKKISARFTTRFYCIQASCILRRFSYFTTSYLKVPIPVKNRLSVNHIDLLRRELSYQG